jgi:hypothetical protein
LPTICKDSTDNVILQIDDVMARWIEHFSDTLNPISTSSSLNLTTEDTDNHDEVELPTCNEICCVINKLKPNKAAGTHNIPAELIRYGGRTLKQKIHNLILNIWNNECLPVQWNEGIICPIYKKVTV